MRSKKQKRIFQKIILLLISLCSILVYSDNNKINTIKNRVIIGISYINLSKANEHNEGYAKSKFYKEEISVEKILMLCKEQRIKKKYYLLNGNLDITNEQIINLQHLEDNETIKLSDLIYNYDKEIFRENHNCSSVKIDFEDENIIELKGILSIKKETIKFTKTIINLLKNIVNKIKQIFTSINKDIIKNTIISWLCLAVILLIIVCINNFKKLF